MKKFLVTVVAIAIVIGIFFILDILSFFVLATKNYTRYSGYNDIPYYLHRYFERYSLKDNLKQHFIYDTKEFRPVENSESKLESIVIFGSCWPWGRGLKENQTFSYYLGKYTKRPIYNRALRGKYLPLLLYQLQHDEFFEIIEKKPKYVIYVFRTGDTKSQYLPTSDCYITYDSYLIYNLKKKKIDNKINYTFVQNRFLTFVHSLPLKIFIKNYVFKNIDFNQYLEYSKQYLIQAKSEATKKWGNDFKFVILVYDYPEKVKIMTPVLKSLEKEGFIIVDINNLSDKTFTSKEYELGFSQDPDNWDIHPNEKAWSEVVPLLVKKLGI